MALVGGEGGAGGQRRVRGTPGAAAREAEAAAAARGLQAAGGAVTWARPGPALPPPGPARVLELTPARAPGSPGRLRGGGWAPGTWQSRLQPRGSIRPPAGGGARLRLPGGGALGSRGGASTMPPRGRCSRAWAPASTVRARVSFF